LKQQKPYNVLFLCTGNSARSIFAECVIERLGRGRFKGFSAGTQPAGVVNPLALQVLLRNAFATSGLRSKSWSEFAGPEAPPMDFVFTVCDSAAAEPCPVWPGQPMTAHWGIPDPAKAGGSEAERMLAFRHALAALERRIDIFVNLPIESLDRLKLQHRIEEIGRMRDQSEEPSEESLGETHGRDRSAFGEYQGVERAR
jgi:arsenate reductase